jgi:hypothetical protein
MRSEYRKITTYPTQTFVSQTEFLGLIDPKAPRQTRQSHPVQAKQGRYDRSAKNNNQIYTKAMASSTVPLSSLKK